MRVAHILTLALATSVHGYANMGLVMEEIRRSEVLQTRSTSLLGDLLGLVDSALTAVGSEIKAILEGTASALADAATYSPPGDKDSSACAADTCCIWSYVVSDMVAKFKDGDQCSSLARGALRLGFHDAATWDSSMSFGGADGSILTSGELSRSDNAGLDTIASKVNGWYRDYKSYNVTRADLIQIGALVATVTCPGGPRIKAVVGRKDSSALPPQGLLPSPTQDAQSLISLFQAKTFSASDLVALVGAHTVSQQFHADTSKSGDSQDSTDGTWDTKFYTETASSSTPDGVYKFPSDVALSQYSGTSGSWTVFGASLGAWNAAFAAAYFRMSLLGVKNLNELTDCTKVLPLPR